MSSSEKYRSLPNRARAVATMRLWLPLPCTMAWYSGARDMSDVPCWSSLPAKLLIAWLLADLVWLGLPAGEGS